MRTRIFAEASIAVLLAAAVLLTGCSKKKKHIVDLEGDHIAPSAVTNLSATVIDTFTVVLRWTAPGDDDTTGTAASYDIRYATRPSVPWASMLSIPAPPTPRAAGLPESLLVTGLSMGGTYYFSMRSYDESSNLSLLSNEASAVTPEHTVGADLIVTTEDDGIWYSLNGGLSWHQATVSNAHRSFGALAATPTDANTLYASGSPYGLGDRPHIYKSTDEGAHWDPQGTDTTFNENSTISAIAVATSAPLVIYAAARGACLSPGTNCVDLAGGVYRSLDGGSTWSDASGTGATGLPMYSNPAYGHVAMHCLAIHPTSAFKVYAGGSDGLYYSNFGGTNWTPISPSAGDSILRVAIDPSNASRVLASSAGAGHALHLSTNSGGSWTNVYSGGGRQPIVFDPTDALIVYSGNGKSTNGGTSWSALTLPAGLSGIDGPQLAVDKQTHDVYAAGRQGVFRSVNGGSTWTQVGSLTNCSGLVVLRP